MGGHRIQYVAASPYYVNRWLDTMVPDDKELQTMGKEIQTEDKPARVDAQVGTPRDQAGTPCSQIGAPGTELEQEPRSEASVSEPSVSEASAKEHLQDQIAHLEDHYDFLIVGAGLFGSTFARCAADAGKKCLVLEKEDHVGGVLYCEQIDGITVHMYGAHILQPKDDAAWALLKDHAAWKEYEYGYVPEGGYNGLIENLLKGSTVLTGISYADFIQYRPNIADKIIYTGAIDEFFSYAKGRLGYTSIDIRIQEINQEFHQDNAIRLVSTYPGWTRSVEFKYFLGEKSSKTVLAYETAYDGWDPDLLPCKPWRTEEDMEHYRAYVAMAEQSAPNVVFCGRHGSYRAYDMSETVSEAMKLARKVL